VSTYFRTRHIPHAEEQLGMKINPDNPKNPIKIMVQTRGNNYEWKKI
jgi:hypothetical protein